MHKFTIIFLLLAFTLGAQTKKPTQKSKREGSVDSMEYAVPTPAPLDTTDPVEESIKAQRKFGVYTRKARKPENRMKLCIQLVSNSSVLNLCFNDSICKYPETSKILFEKTNGDSTYALVFIEAFTKAPDKPSCDAGRETKLVYVRWNTNTNKAIYKQRNVSSCLKVITNMNKEPIVNWDGSSPLAINYLKGGTTFMELRFDPNNYLLGFQSSGDSGGN